MEFINTIYNIKHKNGAIRRVNVNIAATTVENYKNVYALLSFKALPDHSSPKVQYPSSWMSWVMMTRAPRQATTNSLRILGYSLGDCNSYVTASSSKNAGSHKGLGNILRTFS